MRKHTGIQYLSAQDKAWNNRGVALLIALLVTTLLIALIFEFAYNTRISQRSAMNFRDSQRAYFLARSGVNFVGKLMAQNLKMDKKQEMLEQREWFLVPIVSTEETELRVRWEDEGGKINIATVRKPSDAHSRLVRLFDILRINQDTLDRIVEETPNLYLLTDLHKVVSDEEYQGMKNFVTVHGAARININTAPPEVLQSIGISSGMAGMIVDRRSKDPFTDGRTIRDFIGQDNVIANDNVADALSEDSDVFKVNSFATVGGYTKQVEAVIQRSATGFSVRYWRAL